MRIQNLLTFVALATASALAGCSSSSTTNTFPGGGAGPHCRRAGKCWRRRYCRRRCQECRWSYYRAVGGQTGAGGTGGSTGNGTPTGGSPGTQLVAPNGTPTGGTPAVTTGGSPGTPTGGSPGVTTGGSPGTLTGGSPTTGTGGSKPATGGSPTTGTGGTPVSTGGAPTTGIGGSTGTRATPAGYYYTKDWSVTSVDWHGCVWTGIDSTVAGSTTAVTTPSTKDFTGVAEGGPYRIAGTVYNDYNSVALLGFNLNEAITGSTQCAYNAAAASQAGPPVGTIPSSATGIAFNWSAAKAPGIFRIQIQGVDGATNAAHRWCQTITDTQGPSFAPFASFTPSCWSTTAPGTAFNPATDTIDAVVFLVPGTTAATTPFDFTDHWVCTRHEQS